MIEIPFAGQAYTLPSVNAAFQRCLNMYIEAVPGETKGKVILKRRSGLKLFTTVDGTNRRIFTTAKGRMFSVNGDELTEIDINGDKTKRGTFVSTGGPVTMADNGDQLMIVDGSTGYIFNLVSNFFEIIGDPDFPDEATHVTYQDGYLIVNSPASNPAGEWNISNLRNGLSWNALDFGNAEGSPDAVNALISTGRELWLFGVDSVEVFVNTGAANFPFQRVSASHAEVGCFAPYSLARMNTNVFWLGSDKQGFGQIFTNNGYTPLRISTHAIEQEIVKYQTIEDAEGYCYQEGGHSYYVISFVAESKTWVYDVTTGAWHERSFTDWQTNIDSRFKGNTHAFFNGRNYVADPNNGNIYEIDPDTLDDNGNKMKKLRSTPHNYQGLERIFYGSFQLDMQTGVGTADFPDPQGMLRSSKDGGHSFGSRRYESLGKVGEYKKRVKFNRMGAARDMIWEFSVTDSVEVVILGAYIKANTGGVS